MQLCADQLGWIEILVPLKLPVSVTLWIPFWQYLSLIYPLTESSVASGGTGDDGPIPEPRKISTDIVDVDVVPALAPTTITRCRKPNY